MSANDRISFGRMWLDRFVAPYDAAAFERFARRHLNSPRWGRFNVVLGVLLALLMFVAGCGLFAAAAKTRYLEAYGLEAPGTIVDVLSHRDTRSRVEMKKLNYAFTAASGEAGKGQIDRYVTEFAGLPAPIAPGGHLTVLYWERFPSINMPRGVQSNVGISVALGCFLMFACVHFALFAWRVSRWCKSIAEPAA